eukprot:gene4798-5983_t
MIEKSKNDSDRLLKLIEANRSSPKSLYSNDVKDTYFAVGALNRLGVQVPNPSDLCTLVKFNLNTQKSDIEQVFYTTSILSDLKCLDSDYTKDLEPVLTQSLKSGNVLDISYSVNVILTLKKAKAIQFDDALLEPAVGALVSLMDDDGTFKTLASDDDGNLFNTAVVYFALARISNHLKNNEVDKLIDKVVAKMDSVISLSDSVQGALSFNDLQTTSLLLHGIFGLASVNEKVAQRFTPSQVNKVVEYLFRQKNVSTLSDAYYLILGLKRCEKNSIGQPLSLSFTSTKSQLSVRITSVFGEDVPATVTVTKAILSTQPTKNIFENQELTLSGNQYNLDISQLKLGSFIFSFKVVPTTAGFVSFSTSRKITVSGSVELNEFKVSISDSKDNLGKNANEVVFGKKLASVSLPSNSFAKFQFKVNSNGQPFNPQQVGIRFYTPSNEVVVPVTSSADVYSYIVSNKEIGKLLGYHSGNYEMAVIVADQSITPINWNFGEISLSFNQTANPTLRFPEHKPIDHKFRVPEVRPPQSISQIFTLLVLSPTLIFIFGLLIVKVNFNRFPGGIPFVYTLSFIGCVASIALLIVEYWLSLTMVVTLKYLAILLLPTIFFGHKTLAHFASTRLAASQKSN